MNRASVRQTHHTAPPYHTAFSIPSGVMETCLDAWNGYLSVQLDENSRKMTSFITPRGVYRYRTAPQGYLASGDAYTHCYDNIVRDFGDIAKCVDDVCLWGTSNEENFFKTCQYIDLCSKYGHRVQSTEVCLLLRRSGLPRLYSNTRLIETSCSNADWFKTGIGYFLSQKHCQCSDITPTCCPDGWKLILAGSRFTKPAESRYHPVEGEALAVAYVLHKTRSYGCG